MTTARLADSTFRTYSAVRAGLPRPQHLQHSQQQQMQALTRLLRAVGAPGGALSSSHVPLQAALADCCCSSSAARFSTHAGARPAAAATLRRVNLGPANGGSAAAAAGAAVEQAAADGASTSGRDSLLEMSKEVPGGTKPLRTWERVYWGVGVAGISAVLYWNLKKPEKTPEEIEAAKQRAAQLEVKRKEHLRAVLMGQNFLEGDADPLDGLSPAQIVKFMEMHGIDPSDPLEGLTPDEIDAYVQQQEARRQAQEEAQQQ